jgi:acyl carrier protein
MDRGTIEQALAEALDRRGIKYNSALVLQTDTEMDSYEIVRFIIEVEDELGAEFDDDTQMGFVTLSMGELCEALCKLG